MVSGSTLAVPEVPHWKRIMVRRPGKQSRYEMKNRQDLMTEYVRELEWRGDSTVDGEATETEFRTGLEWKITVLGLINLRCPKHI